MENVDLLTAITNLSGELDAILSLIKYVAAVIGVAYIGQAILKGIRASNSTGTMGPDQSTKGWLAAFIVGGLLLDMDHTSSVIFSSFSGGTSLTGLPGGGAAAALGYVPVGGADFSAAIVAVLRIVSLLGWYTVLRGFMCWKAAADGSHGQEDPAWQGATHILFGSLLINITDTMTMLRSSVVG